MRRKSLNRKKNMLKKEWKHKLILIKPIAKDAILLKITQNLVSIQKQKLHTNNATYAAKKIERKNDYYTTYK